MARSPIPAEDWALAEAVYPIKGPVGAKRVLEGLGHRPARGTIVQHMHTRDIVAPSDEWSAAEDDVLRKHAHELDDLALMERLPGRSRTAIEKRRSTLGIYRQRNTGGRQHPTLTIPPREDGELRVVFLSDVQIPEQDRDYRTIAAEFIRHYKPHVLCFLGDMMNATWLGRFPHSNRDPMMDEEASETRLYIEEMVRECPGARVVWIDGNHEFRLQRALVHSPQFTGVIKSMPELLELDRIIGPGNWDYVPYMQGVVEFPGGLLATHGYRVSQHSAYAAKLHVEAAGVSVIHGHTHRLGMFHKTYWDRQVVGIENGSGCVIQSYNPGFVNQQTGFSFTRHWADRFEAWQLKVVNGRAFAEGRWFGGNHE